MLYYYQGVDGLYYESDLSHNILRVISKEDFNFVTRQLNSFMIDKRQIFDDIDGLEVYYRQL